MKKTLLTLALALAGFSANSQVIFAVEAPASIMGNYEMSYATQTAGWGTVDLLDPANVVIDTIVIAYDSSPTADTLMCLSAPAGSLNGKIAMLYRGDCEFGEKAANAQAAGAVAVIIVNNIAGAPIAMSPGSGTPPPGEAVTIPVIMITQEAGAIISSKLYSGEKVVGFIGNKTDFYGVDLGSSMAKVMIAPVQAIPLSVAQNATEFPVDLAAWAFNYGSIQQSGVTMTAEVKKDGVSIYNETSAAFDFVGGSSTEDSVWVDFPPFTPASYSVGTYEITYTITPATADEYDADNTIVTSFEITDDMISLVPLDANGLPVSTGGIQPGTPAGNSFSSCIVFRSPNGSRIGAEGIYFGIQKNAADGDIIGEEVLVQGYRWADQFTDLDDPALDFAALEEKGSGSYTFTADLQDTMIYKAFDTPFMMEDDQRYLFCMTTFSATFKVFHAYNSSIKYDQIELAENQPLSPINNGGEATQWGIGFASRPIPAIGVKTYEAAEAGIFETNTVEASVYPNPAKETVTISIKGFKGDAKMTVTDVAGRIVINKTVTTDEAGKVKVNMNELNNGIYVFNLQMADGTVSNFNVVISK